MAPAPPPQLDGLDLQQAHSWPAGRPKSSSEPARPPPNLGLGSLSRGWGASSKASTSDDDSPEHQRELEEWVRRGYPAALDAIRQTRRCPREGRIAGRAAIAGAEALGDWLAGVGYSVELRVARGGGKGGHCVRNLRNAYLLVAGRGGAPWRGGDALVVDCDFREHFIIAKPSPHYESLLGQLPPHFVGPLDRLVDVVHALCEAARESFEENGLALPVWRQPRGMLSKWLSSDLQTVDLSEDLFPPSLGGAAASGGSLGQACDSGAAELEGDERGCLAHMMTVASRRVSEGGPAPAPPTALSGPLASPQRTPRMPLVGSGSLAGDGCAFLEEAPAARGSLALASSPPLEIPSGRFPAGAPAYAGPPPPPAVAGCVAEPPVAAGGPRPGADLGSPATAAAPLRRSASANALAHFPAGSPGGAPAAARAQLSPSLQTRAHTFSRASVRAF